MANNKKAQPGIKYASMSMQDFNSLMSGGNLAKPLYEFDANGNAIYHEENLQYYSPNIVLTNPFNGRSETASTLVDYVKNEDKHKKAVESTYNSLLKYNHDYNVDSLALQAVKAIPEFVAEAGYTAMQTVGNIANAVHSTGRTVMETHWQAVTSVASDSAKKEMKDTLAAFGDEQSALFYVKNHDFDSDLTLSDETKSLFKNYKALLKTRDNDNLWSNVLDQTFAGGRENVDKALNKESGGNKYQNIGKFAQFSGSIAGSLGVFKAAGMATKALTASKIGAAMTKSFGVTGSTAVYGTAFFNQYDSLRREGLMRGLSYDEANRMAFMGAVFEAFVEGAGISHWGRLSTKTSLLNVIKKEVIPEALEEMVQTGGENIFKSVYGVNTNSFRDVLEEIILSGLGGAIGGAAVGGAEYFHGQVATRVEAARQIREEEETAALEAAKERNQKFLETEYKKFKEPPTDGGEPPAAGGAAAVVEEAQQGPETAQQPAVPLLPYNEQRLLLEHDKQYAEEVAAAQEKFKSTLKEVMTEKLKKANPNITEEQISNASALLFRVANQLENNDAYGAAVSEWAEDIVKWSNERAPQYEKNMADLDKRFGMETLGLSAQDVKDLKSSNRITRHNAQWKFVKASINTELKQAGVSEKWANKMADTFERVFATTALVSNVSPIDLYRKLSPKIISLSRASINGQSIEGYTGVLDNLPESNKETGGLQRIEAEGLLEDLSAKGDDDATRNRKELALSELVPPQMETKSDVTAEDFMQAVETRGRMEQALASEMGISYGRDLTPKDYQTMALMRARGASQSQINEAFGINDRIDPEKEFEDARKKLFPKLSKEELDQAQRLIGRAFADKPFSRVSGMYEMEPKENLNSQTGDSLQAEGNVGGTILLGSDVQDSVAAEEFFHYVSLKLEEAAKIQAIKDSGKRFFASYDIYSLGLLPETKPLARLFAELTKPLNGMELTEREKHETLATAFVNHVTLELMPKEQKEALNLNNGEINDVIATAEDSKYKDLTPEQKKALGDRFTNLFKNETPGELIKAGNQIANAGGNYDVMQARELAMQVLDTYEVYNADQWAYLFSQMDNMKPSEQLDLVQTFGQVLAQQGYDSLTASMYDIEMDENSRQVLVKKAYAEQSLLSEDEDNTVYYHSETANKGKGLSKYKPNSDWWSKFKKWGKKTFNPEPLISDYIESLSHAAFKADPVIGTVLRRAMYAYGRREIAWQKLAARIPQLIDKYKLDLLSEEKKPIFDANFKNVLLAGNPKARQKAKAWIVEQFAGTGAMEEVGKIMDDIYKAIDACRDDLIARGVPVGYIKEYWPSYVNDRDGLAEYLGKAAPTTQTGKMINRLVKELTKKFPKASMEELRRMAIDAINQQWHKYEMGEDVSAFHKRGNYFTPETSEFYENPFETLARYFENVNRTIMMRELTGRVIPSLENEGEYTTNFEKALIAYRNKPETIVDFKEGETGKLGKAFAFALTKPNPDMQALDNFARKMKLFVNKVGTQRSEFTRFWERTNSMLLGNPISVLNQFNELPLILHNFGLEVTNEAIREAVDEILNEQEAEGSANLENINVQALQELIRYKDNDLLAKLTDMIHTASGFAGADVLLKNIEIKACLIGAQKVLKSGDVNDIRFKRFMKLFDNTFPEAIYSDKTRMGIIEDLKAGNLTDNVKFFAFNYLSNVQPVNMAEVPTGFLNAGALGRLVYQYHTTPLRQLEYVADDVRWGFMQLPLKDAIKNLLGYMMFFMAIGVPIEVLQNLLRGRKTNIAEAALYSPFQLLSINEYTINSIKERGLFSGIIQELSPSFRIGDDVTKDVIRVVTMKDYKGNAVKDVPLAGPFVYYWLLGGRDYARRQGEAIGVDSEDDNKRTNAIKAITGR